MKKNTTSKCFGVLKHYSSFEIKLQTFWMKKRDHIFDLIFGNKIFWGRISPISPNFFTIFGMFLILPFIYFFEKNVYLSLLAFLLHLFVDAFDGSYARMSRRVSKIGGILDFLSDHLAILAGVYLIVQHSLGKTFFALAYVFIYFLLLCLAFYLGRCGLKVPTYFRSKYVIYIFLFLCGLFGLNFLDEVLLFFSVVMMIDILRFLLILISWKTVCPVVEVRNRENF